MNFNNVVFNLEDFELIKEMIGNGTFGTVFAVKNIKEDKQYAAKVLNCCDEFDGTEQIKLLQESIKFIKIDHPSIVKFYGINFKSIRDQSAFSPTILNEYYSSKSLKDCLQNQDQNFTFTKRYKALIWISDAMRYLHDQDILNLDLKPENILFDSNFYPKITDFCLSSLLFNLFSRNIKSIINKDKESLVYIVPEILKGENNYTKSYDVYSFSMLAYSILTNKKPYYELGDSISISELKTKILSGYRPELTSDIPDKMKELMSKCWNEKPEERPSFREVLLELMDFHNVSDDLDADELEYSIEYIKKTLKIEEEKMFDDFQKALINLATLDVNKTTKSKEEKQREIANSQNNLLENYNIIFPESNLHFCSGLVALFENTTPNIVKAIFEMHLASQKGNPYASFIIGLLYYYGHFLEKNHEKGLEYLIKSGEQGNPRAYNAIGVFYFKEKKYKKALEYYNKAKDLGDLTSIYNIGEMYRIGQGVEKDYSKALEYFQESINKGNMESLVSIGQMYEEGNLGPKDNKKALEFYLLAAKANCGGGYYNAGRMYCKGKGCDVDYKTAFQYFKEGHQLHNIEASNMLASMYLYGKGVSKNEEMAFEIYQRSAKENDSEALFRLGYMYCFGIGIEKNHDLGYSYYCKSAQQDNSSGCAGVGFCYRYGYGVQKNYPLAIKWYQKSADLGNSFALPKIGEIYEEEDNSIKDLNKALLFYQKAVDLNNYDGFVRLGLLYENGKGVAKDYGKAFECYQKAARRGSSEALILIGKMYEFKKGYRRDYPTAMKYYQQAADLGNSDGFIAIGSLYENGKGVTKSLATAFEYYQKAEKK